MTKRSPSLRFRVGVRLLLISLAAFSCGAEESPEAETSQALRLGPGFDLPPVQPISPALTSLSPTMGPPGTQVIVTGHGLTRLSTTAKFLTVRFSNDPTNVVPTTAVLSDTQLRVTAPPNTRGGKICLYLLTTQRSCTTNDFRLPPAPGAVRVQNEAQYPLLSAVFNGQEWLAPGFIDAGSAAVFSPVTPGQYGATFAIGFGPYAGPAANKKICDATLAGTLTVDPGETELVRVRPITVAQLLGRCRDVDYTTSYLDSQGGGHWGVLRILGGSTGRWELYFDDGSRPYASGALTSTSWQPNSPFVTFTLDGANWPAITAGYPYQTFYGGPVGQTLRWDRATAW